MNGFVATSKFERASVEEVIAGKLKDAGIKKHKKKKKFYVYKGISLPEISPSKIDLYYKVSKKKHKSKIYLVASKGYDNYITSATDATGATNITNFLSKIDEEANRNEEIKKKEQEVKTMDENIRKEKDAIKKAEDEKKKKSQQLEQLHKDR